MTDHHIRPGVDASPGMPTSPTATSVDFVGRVMATVGSSTPPSAPRSFLEATRDRSWRDATSSLLVASHLVMRARTVPIPVRAQALALVAVVALLTGAGATLAATTAYRVAAPIIGLAGLDDGGESRALPTAAATSPIPAPLLPQPAIAAPPPADEPDGVFHNDTRRRPGAWHAGDDTGADSSEDDRGNSSDPGAADQDDVDEDREDARDEDGSDADDETEDAGDEARDASDDDPDDGSTGEADDETEDAGGDDGGSDDGGSDDEPDETETPEPDDDGAEEPVGETGD